MQPANDQTQKPQIIHTSPVFVALTEGDLFVISPRSLTWEN